MDSLLNKTRVFVVEDEIVVSEDLQERLKTLGFSVVGAADTAADAIRLATVAKPDVALMDIMLHGRPEGIDAAEYLRRELDIPIIYLTAHSDAATLQKARLTDPSGYIVKPFDDAQLRVAIELAPQRHEMERKARRVARWLNATLTSIGDAVVATNTNGEIILLNPAAEQLTGWNQDEAIGKPCSTVVQLYNKKSRQALPDPAIRALEHGITVRIDPDTVLLTSTGEERFVDDSASPIIDEEGNVLGAVVVLVDSTDRVTAQSRVQELTNQVIQLLTEKEQIELLSNELEAFAAAISHDLRAPLHAIAGFSYLLTEQHRDRLDSLGQRFLDQIQKNAEQMNCMIQDYLGFMGSSRQPHQPVMVDLQQIAKDVFTSLTSLPNQKPVKIVYGTLPQVWGDKAMLRQLFANLLGNAFKYSSHCEQPVVEVGVITGETPGKKAGEDSYTLFVRDNGVGMDMANATKLFEPFHRFHSAAEFSGTGVGLSIVKRIVERHGGHIWAESKPGAGATFFFTLPRQAAAGG